MWCIRVKPENGTTKTRTSNENTFKCSCNFRWLRRMPWQTSFTKWFRFCHFILLLFFCWNLLKLFKKGETCMQLPSIYKLWAKVSSFQQTEWIWFWCVQKSTKFHSNFPYLFRFYKNDIYVVCFSVQEELEFMLKQMMLLNCKTGKWTVYFLCEFH